VIALFLTFHAARELDFYRRNGWDFGVNSKSKVNFFWSDSSQPSEKMSNRQRVSYGYPFFLAVFWFFFFALLLT